jgi:hypothetical protein
MKIVTAGMMGLAIGLTSGFGHAQSIFTDENGKTAPQTLSLPYAFYNENFGAAVGWVYGVTGIPQPQSSIITTAIAGSEGSGMATIIGRDLQLNWSERLFLDPIISIGYFSDADAYIDGNPQFAGERAGSNDSDEDNFITGDGWDNLFRLRLKYLLPIGDGEDDIIGTYRLRDGLPIHEFSGGNVYNPFASGKSYVQLKPFYRWQQIKDDNIKEDIQTNGVDLAFFWDNRDFFQNPSEGHSVRLQLSRDFGWFDSDDSWTVVEGEIDKYVSLGKSDWFRQRVLAFNMWTSYSPTWDEDENGEIDHRPPAYAGATLGGLWRMRGYPSQRFNDKAAVYYAAEARFIPHWNPFDRWPELQKHIGVEWLQIAPFVEVGRVASEWDIGDLHEDMKWDVGVGLRAHAKGLVVRVDTAVSEEGGSVQMMVSQPFQF